MESLVDLSLLMMLVGGRVITLQAAGCYRVGLHLWRGTGFEGWTKTAVTPHSDGVLTLDNASATTGSDPAAATTIISFVPGVKIGFVELYRSGLTKKQTIQLDAVELTP